MLNTAYYAIYSNYSTLLSASPGFATLSCLAINILLNSAAKPAII